MTLCRWELAKVAGRGGAKLLGLASDSLRAGRLGVDRVGLIDEGGVIELEAVSMVEDDFPEISSTLGGGFLSKVKAFERRRLKKAMIWSVERERKSP